MNNKFAKHGSEEEDEAYISHVCQQPRFAAELELKACIAISSVPLLKKVPEKQLNESMESSDLKIQH